MLIGVSTYTTFPINPKIITIGFFLKYFNKVGITKLESLPTVEYPSIKIKIKNKKKNRNSENTPFLSQQQSIQSKLPQGTAF